MALTQRWKKHNRPTRRWQDTVWGIVEVGKLLIQAKDALEHGEFLKMFKGDIPFREDTAQRLMAIAGNQVLSNTAYTRYLPPSWYTLSILTQLPERQFLKQLKVGAIHPEIERSEAQALVRGLLRPPGTEPPANRLGLGVAPNISNRACTHGFPAWAYPKTAARCRFPPTPGL